MATRVVSQTIDLVNPDESVSKYITDITDQGIIIHPKAQTEEGANQIQIDGDGLKITNNGIEIAKYTTDGIQIGTNENFNLKINAEELGFYDKDIQVAYLNGQTLYITKSVVVDEMRVGTREVNNQEQEEWSWKYDPNDRSLYLKWIGV